MAGGDDQPGGIATAQHAADEAPLPPPAGAPPRRAPRAAPLWHPWWTAIAVVATWAALLPSSPLRSVGAASCLAVAAAASVVATCPARHQALLALAASAFLPWLAVRSSPWLITVDLLLFSALMLAAGTGGIGGSRTAGTAFRRLAGTATVAVVSGPASYARQLSADMPRSVASPLHLISLLRSATVPVIVSVGCLVLLASGDALFASYLDLGWVVESAASRVGAGLLGGMMLLWLVGTTGAPTTPPRPARALSAARVVMTLIGLAAVIGAFGATQLSAALLGADYVQARTGLTYADYARSGFFQLVAVAAIASAAVASARRLVQSQRAPRGTIALSCTVTIAVLAMVASSIIKLAVYMDRFGLTMLRLYTTVFSVWIAIAVVLTLVAFWRRVDHLLIPVIAATIVIGGFAMNIVNPERIVADHNLERALAGAELDTAYLARLSDDAAPTVLRSLDGFTGAARVTLSDRWCLRTDAARGWAAWNQSASSAQRAERRFCR
jgi:hypothetical protein